MTEPSNPITDLVRFDERLTALRRDVERLEASVRESIQGVSRDVERSEKIFRQSLGDVARDVHDTCEEISREVKDLAKQVEVVSGQARKVRWFFILVTSTAAGVSFLLSLFKDVMSLFGKGP